MPKHTTRIEKYVKAGGNHCLYCGSDKLGYGEIRERAEGESLPPILAIHESPSNPIVTAFQDVRCVDCGSKWIDVYRLITIKEVSHVATTR